MAEAQRRPETDPAYRPGEPANTNQAPRPRLVADNEIRGTAQLAKRPSPSQPILHQGHVLRYKTPAEWEEFGRLNPDIPQQYWDSPTFSAREDRKARRQIQKRERAQTAEAQRTIGMKPGANNPYGVTPEASREYRNERARESLRARKERTVAAQAEKKLVKEQQAQTKKSVRALGAAAGKFIGPKQLASGDVTGAIGSSFAASSASLLVTVWFPFQLMLAAGAAVFLAMGGLGGGVITGAASLLEDMGLNILTEGASMIFGGFIAVGAMFYLLMVTISLIQLFIIRSLMKIGSLASSSSANNNRRPSRVWFYLAVLGCLLPLFILSLLWINALRRNPG